MAFVKARIGSVKAPKQVEVWPDLPRSKVGKVLKAEIRATMLAERSRHPARTLIANHRTDHCAAPLHRCRTMTGGALRRRAGASSGAMAPICRCTDYVIPL